MNAGLTRELIDVRNARPVLYEEDVLQITWRQELIAVNEEVFYLAVNVKAEIGTELDFIL